MFNSPIENSHSFIASNIKQPILPASSSKTKVATIDKIKTSLRKFADDIYRSGIILTGVLPFSSRGIILNVALTPIRMIQSAGPGFIQKMKKHMERNWNQGIQDFYTNLELPQNQELRKKVVEENFRYAAYMYQAFSNTKNGGDRGILLDFLKLGQPSLISYIAEYPTLQLIHNKLSEIGFNVDSAGNYYDIKTGSMFNLTFDIERKEIVISFMGLGNEIFLNIDTKEKEKINSEATKAAVADWLGGIPLSTRQAIEIGKILKETTANTKITPVMVGHSHGGGLAQAGAVANNLKGVVFNSRPLGAGTRRYISQSVIAQNAKQITTFSGRGDWLSGTVIVNRLAIIFERLTGIPVPRSVGTGYHLPNMPEESMMRNHVGFYESFRRLKNMCN